MSTGERPSATVIIIIGGNVSDGNHFYYLNIPLFIRLQTPFYRSIDMKNVIDNPRVWVRVPREHEFHYESFVFTRIAVSPSEPPSIRPFGDSVRQRGRSDACFLTQDSMNLESSCLISQILLHHFYVCTNPNTTTIDDRRARAHPFFNFYA